MISQPSDYAFIDWQAGDMPTSLINGEIMPLRQTERKRDLRGVDIAFLSENMSECRCAFAGTQVSVGPGEWAVIESPESSYSLTKYLSHDQIQSRISQRLNSFLSGHYYAYHAFWQNGSLTGTQLYSGRQETPSNAEIRGMMTEQLDYHDLNETPSVPASAFDKGEYVDQDKVASLFADARKLRYPVIWGGGAGSLGSMFAANEWAHEYSGSGTMPSEWQGLTGFMFEAYYDQGQNKRVWCWPNSLREIIRVPLTYLSDVHVYMVWDHWHDAAGSVGTETESWHRGGIMDLEPYLVSSVSGGVKGYVANPALMKQLAHDMMYGDEATGVNTVRVERLYRTQLFLLGTLNSRTQWW